MRDVDSNIVLNIFLSALQQHNTISECVCRTTKPTDNGKAHDIAGSTTSRHAPSEILTHFCGKILQTRPLSTLHRTASQLTPLTYDEERKEYGWRVIVRGIRSSRRSHFDDCVLAVGTRLIPNNVVPSEAAGINRALLIERASTVRFGIVVPIRMIPERIFATERHSSIARDR
jgi:hypothetical protein